MPKTVTVYAWADNSWMYEHHWDDFYLRNGYSDDWEELTFPIDTDGQEIDNFINNRRISMKNMNELKIDKAKTSIVIACLCVVAFAIIVGQLSQPVENTEKTAYQWRYGNEIN
jgi:hypothetical protein